MSIPKVEGGVYKNGSSSNAIWIKNMSRGVPHFICRQETIEYPRNPALKPLSTLSLLELLQEGSGVIHYICRCIATFYAYLSRRSRNKSSGWQEVETLFIYAGISHQRKNIYQAVHTNMKPNVTWLYQLRKINES